MRSKKRRCPFKRCDGSGIIVDEETRTSTYCACHDQLVAAARAQGLASVIPRRYRGLSFDREPIASIDTSAVAKIRDYVTHIDERLDAGTGLWLSGPIGVGKTSLAMLVAQMTIAAGRSVAIYSLPRLLTDLRAAYDDGAAVNRTTLLDRLSAVDLLQIDDAGAEKTSDWVLEQLYLIIDARYANERSLMITTNLGLEDEIGAQIGMRTVSRIAQMCQLIPVGGIDHRRPRPDDPSIMDETDITGPTVGQTRLATGDHRRFFDSDFNLRDDFGDPNYH